MDEEATAAIIEIVTQINDLSGGLLDALTKGKSGGAEGGPPEGAPPGGPGPEQGPPPGA